jgi:hypothetical protein
LVWGSALLALSGWLLPAVEEPPPPSEGGKWRVPLVVKATDPDGDPLTYEWVQVSGPKVKIANPGSDNTYFIPAEPGEYVFEIRISDGAATVSQRVTRVVTLPNEPPVAVAGANQIYELGQRVRVDGGRSFDRDGKIAQYQWQQASGPDLKLTKEQLEDRQFDFQPAEAGSWIFELKVFDGKDWSVPSRTTVTVRPPNRKPVIDVAAERQEAELPVKPVQVTPGLPGPNAPPVAVAAKGGVVALGEELTLDGSGSSDPLGEDLEYFWSQKENGKSPLLRSLQHDPASATGGRQGLMFCPVWHGKPAQPGLYEFVLEVTAGKGKRKASTSVTFEVRSAQQPPVAEVFMPEPKVEKGQSVTLDGSRSRDPDGGPLEYTWMWSGKGNRPAHWAGEGARVQFVAEQEGTYGIRLVVSNGKAKSAPYDVVIEVGAANQPPVVEVPASVEGTVGQPVRVTAKVSDPENDRSTVAWSVVDPPGLKLPAEVLAANPLVFTPQEKRVYVFSVVARDAKGQSAPARVQVAARGDVDLPPTAIVDGPRSAPAGKAVTLSGERSSDPEKKRLTYLWKQSGGPRIPGPVPGLNDSRWEFTPAEAGEYQVALAVSDGATESEPHVWRLTIERANQPPVAAIEPPGKAAVGDELWLGGSSSRDPEGDPLTYSWRAVEGAEKVELGARDWPKLKVKALAAGQARIELVVNDGKSDSKPASATLTIGEKPVSVAAETPAKKDERPPAEPAAKKDDGPAAGDEGGPPIAAASGPTSLFLGQEATLEGAESRAAKGCELTEYHWSQLPDGGPPAGLKDEALSGETLAFRPAKPGTYVFQLVVVDSKGRRSQPTRCSFSVLEAVRAPVAKLELQSVAPHAVGKPLVFSGRGSSDPGGRPLSYRWRVIGDHAAKLPLPADPGDTLKATPTEPGDYVLELRVTNGQSESPATSLSFQVQASAQTPAPAEGRPVAAIAEVTLCEPGGRIVLDGSGSRSPSGKSLDFHWACISQPEGAKVSFGFRGYRRPKPEVTLAKAGEYVFELKVVEGRDESEPARVTIRTRPPNQSPVASAVALAGFTDADLKSGVDLVSLPYVVKGDALAVEEGRTVILDGSGSRDPDAGPQPLTCTWKCMSRPAPDKVVQDGPRLRFVAPAAGSVVYELVVSDGKTPSAPARVTVNVFKPGGLPVARARLYVCRKDDPPPDGREQSLEIPCFRRSVPNNPNAPILILDGQRSEAPAKAGGAAKAAPQLRYTWRQIAGEDLQLRPEKLAQPRVGLLIYHPGRYRFMLVVSDGEHYSLPALVEVTVKDPALAGREAVPKPAPPERDPRTQDTKADEDGALLPPPRDVQLPALPKPKTATRPDQVSLPPPGPARPVARLLTPAEEAAAKPVLEPDTARPARAPAPVEARVPAKEEGAKPGQKVTETAPLAPVTEEPSRARTHAAPPDSGTARKPPAGKPVAPPPLAPAAPLKPEPDLPEVAARVERCAREGYRAKDPIFVRRRQREEALAAQAGPEAEGELLRFLKDKDEDLRASAAVALVQRGLGSAPALIRVLEEENCAAQGEALWALQRLSHQSFPADPARWRKWWDDLQSLSAP